MSRQVRIGACHEWNWSDVFWIQVHEAIYRRAQENNIELIFFGNDFVSEDLSLENQETAIEEIISQELEVLIGWGFYEKLVYRLLDNELPIVHLSETAIEHPLSVSPLGLQSAAEQITEFLAEALQGQGHILVIGGLLLADRTDDGRSRIAGIQHVFEQYPALHWHHIPTYWEYTRAYTQIGDSLAQCPHTFDAILGLSDSLALWGREVALKLGHCQENVLVAGINGDPSAVEAIMGGRMMASIETSATALGKQAFDLAYKIALGQPYPAHYSYESRLITTDNVATCAAEKLAAIAYIPAWLVRSKSQRQQEYLTYLSTSLKISQQLGSVLDDQHLPVELAALIKTNYGYDHVQLFYWSERMQTLTRVDPNASHQATSLSLLDAEILTEALTQDEFIFIPDMQCSFRFEPDPNWPEIRSRIIIPIKYAGKKMGVLDLHALEVMRCTRLQRVGLQALADQLGVAIQNARLYQKALHAQAAAEKADQLKTRLLANLSHELRHPLHLILHYIDTLSADHQPEAVQIEHNARHLLRLINDLLDLSRAEIDELSIEPEIIEPIPFLTELFESIADSQRANTPDVTWRLELPQCLPVIQADPDRLRQIVINLLSNAGKFTSRGHITLGVDIVPPYLHLWVEDTGTGIHAREQESVFEPFITGEQGMLRPGGVGLGLSITRRLVALHEGYMALDSQAGQGSTFHVYLPLPNLAGMVNKPPNITRPVLLVVTGQNDLPPELQHYCEQQQLEARLVRSVDDVEYELRLGTPTAMAWDTRSLGENGWEIVGHLRSYSALCSLPFLLYGPPLSPTISSPGQLTNIMLKPVRPKSLIEAVSSLYSQRITDPILVVDDDPEARRLYAEIINQHLGKTLCRTASNGVEARAIMAQDVPQLVILDLMMPEMDGFQVVEWMRTNKNTMQVPIVILSGKMLTFEDITHLEPYQKIVFQTKDILSDDEMAAMFQQVMLDHQPLPPQTSAVVKHTVAYIHQNYTQTFSRSDIAQTIGINENYLTQIFRQELGINLWEYLNRYRVTQAKELLIQTSESIAYIATQVGFDDPAYFSRVFRRYVGRSPRIYRESPELS